MSVPPHSSIRPGTLVSIVLKQDQRTGHQVQGSVKDVLTRSNHPRGVKVRLSDGRVGRVQQLVNQSDAKASARTQQISYEDYQNSKKMADHNPWASESQDTSNTNRNQHQYQPPQGQPNSGYPQQRFYGEEGAHQNQPPYQHQSYQAPQRNTQDFPNAQAYSQQPDYNAWSDASGNPPLPQRHPAHIGIPQQGIHRSDTEDLLAREPDRSEQMEHMQAYEATANQSQEDKDRAQLEKEFPDVDGSLIAALYSDTKDLSATREMLQELGRQ